MLKRYMPYMSYSRGLHSMTKFQKRHYLELVKVINHVTMSDGLISHEDLVNELCGMLRADNPNFNEKTFRAALWDD